jgi:hypothetical protein
MAKNEIKMLLLGAGESGKVRRSNPQPGRRGLNFLSIVNSVKANEAYPPRRIQRL